MGARMHATARISAVVAWHTIIGWSSVCSVSEASETQAQPAPGQADSLEEARKNPEAVETLLLHGRGLKQIPEEVFRLPNLRKLYLSGNQLTEVPGDIGKLKNLTVLDLDDNRIRSLPEEIGHLPKLTRLTLHDNPLEYLPDSLSRLLTLRELTLFHTRLEGKIPAGLVQLLKDGSPELIVTCDWEAFDDIEDYRLNSSKRAEVTYDESGRTYLALGIEPSSAAATANVFLYRHKERGVMLFDPELEESATELECHPDNPALDALASQERIRTLEERCKPELFSVSLRGIESLAVSRVTAETVEVCGSAVISVGAQVGPPPSDVLLVVSSDAPPAPVVVRPESLRSKEWPESIREEDFGFPKGVYFKRVTFFRLPGDSEIEFLAEVVTRGLHFIVGQEGKDYQWIEATWMFFVGDEGVKLLSPSAGDWSYVGGPDASFRAAADLDGNGELDLVLGTTDLVVFFRHRGGYLRKGLPYFPPRGC